MSQLQQPVEQLYPNPVISTSQANASHSNGSFGPVFIVLAVIVVISAAACVLGRLCNRRLNRVKEGGHHHKQPKSKPNKLPEIRQGLGPKEWESRQKPSFNTRDGDIEFGFDMKMPSVRNGGGGGKVRPTNIPSAGHGPGHGHGHGPGHGPAGPGHAQGHGPGHGYRPDVRFANNV